MKHFIFLFLVALVLASACAPSKTVILDDYSVRNDVVIMYSASWCYWCDRAKEFFVENEIEYIERDLESESDMKWLRGYADSINYTGTLNIVPLFIIHGRIIRGWDKDEILFFLGRGKDFPKIYGDIDGAKGSFVFTK